MSLQYIRTEDLLRAAANQPLPVGVFIGRLYMAGAITVKVAERAHHAHCRAGRGG